MLHKWIAALSMAALVLPTSPTQAGDTPWSERAVPPVPDLVTSGTLSKAELDALIDYGEVLFGARFTTLDGAGRKMATQAIIPTKRKRPPREEFSRTAGLDANSCASCHHTPVIGGAGDFAANVFVSEGFDNADFDSTDPQFSNERNTNHLFGAGLVELLAREMTADLQAIRAKAAKQARAEGRSVTLALETKGVDFGAITVAADGMVDLSGLDGVDTDLVIRPFSQKGVMTSLRQFTVNALNHHHGIQPDERFGTRWTGEADFDEDGVDNEMSADHVSALVAWQATLPPPSPFVPDNAAWREAAARGSDVFDAIGCASCHVRALPLQSLQFADPGPYDTAGTLRAGEVEGAVYDLSLLDWAADLPRNADGHVMVPLFGDLKRHRIADREIAALGNELLAQRFVDRDVFQTSELWGIADTDPYGHRGSMTTLDEVIRAHGGDAYDQGRAYEALSDDARSDLIAYLKTLVIKP